MAAFCVCWRCQASNPRPAHCRSNSGLPNRPPVAWSVRGLWCKAWPCLYGIGHCAGGSACAVLTSGLLLLVAGVAGWWPLQTIGDEVAHLWVLDRETWCRVHCCGMAYCGSLFEGLRHAAVSEVWLWALLYRQHLHVCSLACFLSTQAGAARFGLWTALCLFTTLPADIAHARALLEPCHACDAALRREVWCLWANPVLCC